MNKIVFIILTTVLILGCKPTQTAAPEILTWEISEEKAPCEGVTSTNCLQIKQEGKELWELFYEPIEGFNYREGYAYTIKVEASPVEKPAADASSKTYKLITILSQKNTTDVVNGIPLLKGNFNVTSLNGRDVKESKLSLNIDADTKMISGFAGCNTYNLKFRQKGTLIRFAQVGKGRNYCEDTAQLEKEFLITYVQGDHFELKGGILKIYALKNQILEAILAE